MNKETPTFRDDTPLSSNSHGIEALPVEGYDRFLEDYVERTTVYRQIYLYRVKMNRNVTFPSRGDEACFAPANTTLFSCHFSARRFRTNERIRTI